MKRIIFNVWAWIALLGIALPSCNDDDAYSVGDLAIDWVTVNTHEGQIYDFMGDTWGKLWPAVANMPAQTATDGQRAILYFNPLYDNFPEGYDCSVKVMRLQPVLTKQVEELTAENEAEYGNDPVSILKGNIWIGKGGYLNIIFNQNMPAQEKHRVSLVKNTTVVPDADGYIHLEYRYNTYGDTTGYWGQGAVSFNLQSLDVTKETKGIKLKINSATNGEQELVFDLKVVESPSQLSKMDLSLTSVQ